MTIIQIEPEVVRTISGLPQYMDGCIVITHITRPIFQPVSVERFLLARIREAQKELADYQRRHQDLVGEAHQRSEQKSYQWMLANHPAISVKHGTTCTCKGVAQLHSNGGMGTLRISVDPVGNCEMNERGKVLRHPGYASVDFTCSFENVDLVNGGSYEVQSDGEEAQWTKCTLELTPKQKN